MQDSGNSILVNFFGSDNVTLLSIQMESDYSYYFKHQEREVGGGERRGSGGEGRHCLKSVFAQTP